MKFLFKITLLILIYTSNSVFSSEQNAQQIEESATKKLGKYTKIEQLKQYYAQINSCVEEIIMSNDCNCTKLSLLDNEQLDIAKFKLVMLPYRRPKSEQELDEAEKELSEFFLNLKGLSDKEVKNAIEWRLEVIKKENEEMKCVKKMIKAINELKKQNKSE